MPQQRRLPTRFLGYGLALLSTAIVATTFIVSKAVLKTLNPESFSILWYGAAAVYAALYGHVRGDTPPARTLRRQWKPLLALACTNALSALLWFSEIKMADPALVSFFGCMSTLFAVLLGVGLLGEQLQHQEWAGAALILAGVLMITYYSDRVVLLVFIMALGNTFLHASGAVIAKCAVGDVTPLTLTLVRAGGTSIIILIVTLLTGRWEWPSIGALALIALGALGGPFISHILFYRALALIDVSQVSLINATRPLFVLLYSLLLLGSLPLLHQIAGGLLSIIGVVTLLSARRLAPAYQAERVVKQKEQ